ncbi:uncharacterized protein [Mytilus edulis]|uniref:uncharacterized protein n=1 Tax=Mytilus edulis TaxID=6550 RepID=UPI0039F13486
MEDTGQCRLTFGSQPLDYPKPVVELDGLTPVDLVVDATIDVTNRDYSFSIMVRPTNDTGALLHYKTDDTTKQLQELAFYISGGYFHMERILKTKSEISPPSTVQMPINTWNFITFGINFGNGEIIIAFNGDTKMHDNNYDQEVEFVIPGILRVGGMFDERKPNLKGRVACVGFYIDMKRPRQSDSEQYCMAPTWTNNMPNCSTPAIPRTETAAGYFMKEVNIQLSNLNMISTSSKCTRLRCALSCLRDKRCWFFRYEPSASGCSQCTLYDSSVKGTGTGDKFLYKWI